MTTANSLPAWGKKSRGVFAAVLLPVLGLMPMERAVAAIQPAAVAESGVQLAQVDQTILNFDNTNYAVRVFLRGGQTLMNVYNKRTDQVIVDAQPATFVPTSGPNDAYSSYRALGTFNAQPATFFARVDRVNNTLLEIFDAQGGLIRQEFGGPTPVVALPANQRPPSPIQLNTRLAFSTASFATRVYQDTDNILKMNVYTRDNTPLQNGVAATPVQNPVAPYENWVSYVSNGTFQGIPVRYFTRINGVGETRFEIVDAASGSTLLSQPGIGEVTVNIPPSERPPGVDQPTAAASENLNPYIAAVFGDDNTLSQLQQLQNTFAGGGEVPLLQEPQFESSRLGRFINAGSYRSRDEAAAVVSLLRSRGFNSRLVYRNFMYR